MHLPGYGKWSYTGNVAGYMQSVSDCVYLHPHDKLSATAGRGTNDWSIPTHQASFSGTLALNSTVNGYAIQRALNSYLSDSVCRNLTYMFES